MHLQAVLEDGVKRRAELMEQDAPGAGLGWSLQGDHLMEALLE